MQTANAGARLDRLPPSRFHYQMLGLIGGGMFLDAFEIYLQGAVLAALIGIGWSTPAMNANFISVTFAGMVVGAWFAGILGDDVTRTRELLRRLDLAAPSLHADYAGLKSNPEKWFETARVLEARFVVCPWLDPSERQTADDWKRICDNLNAIGERATRAGLVLAYHNHDFEFVDLAAGVRPYDLLLSRTDERFLKFELDVYWATKGKADPAPLLRAHPSRFRLVHLKDMATDGSFTEIGNGTLDFGDIIEAALQSGVEHFFVEQDVAPDPLRSIAVSIAYLRRLG